jgi:hypothetical protein
MGGKGRGDEVGGGWTWTWWRETAMIWREGEAIVEKGDEGRRRDEGRKDGGECDRREIGIE